MTTPENRLPSVDPTQPQPRQIDQDPITVIYPAPDDPDRYVPATPLDAALGDNVPTMPVDIYDAYVAKVRGSQTITHEKLAELLGRSLEDKKKNPNPQDIEFINLLMQAMQRRGVVSTHRIGGHDNPFFVEGSYKPTPAPGPYETLPRSKKIAQKLGFTAAGQRAGSFASYANRRVGLGSYPEPVKAPTAAQIEAQRNKLPAGFKLVKSKISNVDYPPEGTRYEDVRVFPQLRRPGEPDPIEVEKKQRERRARQEQFDRDDNIFRFVAGDFRRGPQQGTPFDTVSAESIANHMMQYNAVALRTEVEVMQQYGGRAGVRSLPAEQQARIQGEIDGKIEKEYEKVLRQAENAFSNLTAHGIVAPDIEVRPDGSRATVYRVVRNADQIREIQAYVRQRHERRSRA